MYDLMLLLMLVGLSAAIGYLAGYAYRGSEWRRRRKARRAQWKRFRSYGAGEPAE